MPATAAEARGWLNVFLSTPIKAADDFTRGRPKRPLLFFMPLTLPALLLAPPLKLDRLDMDFDGLRILAALSPASSLTSLLTLLVTLPLSRSVKMCDCSSKTVTVEAQLSLLVMEGLRLCCPGRGCETWLFCCWSCWAVRPYGMLLLLLLLLGLRTAADAVASMAASKERRDCLAAPGVEVVGVAAAHGPARAAGDAAAATTRGGCVGVTVSSDAVTACCRSIWANGELETDSVLGTCRVGKAAAGAPAAVTAATPPVDDTAPAAVGVETRAGAAAVWPAGGVLSTPADLLRLWCGLGTGTAAAAASTRP